MFYQLGALDGFCRVEGVRMNHVKPHGALYNATFEDAELARTIAEAVRDYNPELKLMGLSNQNLVRAGEEAGLEVRHEVFADRAYEDDGTLVSRKKEGAMVTDTKQAVDRVVRMVKEGKVESINGRDIDMKADSICVHGDGPKALEFVKEIRSALGKEDITIQTM